MYSIKFNVEAYKCFLQTPASRRTRGPPDMRRAPLGQAPKKKEKEDQEKSNQQCLTLGFEQPPSSVHGQVRSGQVYYSAEV